MIVHSVVKAQNGYTLVGSARSGSALDCYQLTSAIDGQTGAVWFDKQLRLTESFELTFSLNFGANAFGADGMAVVFQTQGKQVLGGAGSGIGYRDLSPSLDIEFDTNFNPDKGDLAEDHTALAINGVTDHWLNTTVAPPVPISTTQKTVKDGRDHYVKVSWNATIHTLLVEVDCVTRINQTIDLVNGIFTGKPEVYWGFTSATGSANNAHKVCILSEQIQSDTIKACRNDQITLTAPFSSNGEYQWTPSVGLDNSHSRTPHLRVSNSQFYTVQYVDHCARPKFDSVFVNTKSINFSIGNDRQICENDSVILRPTIAPTSAPVMYQWSTGQTTPQLRPTTSGQYSLTITADGCSISDSAIVTFTPSPKFGLSIEPTYNCPDNQLIRLDPQATGTGLHYFWSPGGSEEPTLIASTPGTYTAWVSTDIGCYSIQKFVILDNCPSLQVFVPDAFTPNGDGINDLLKWQGGSNIEAQMKVFDRWGEVIFASTNSSPYWDGTYQGKLCSPATYTWSLEYWPRLTVNQQVGIMQGKVLLLK